MGCNALRLELQTPSMFFEFRHVSCWFVAFIIASCALHHVIMQPVLKLNQINRMDLRPI